MTKDNLEKAAEKFSAEYKDASVVPSITFTAAKKEETLKATLLTLAYF
jgi:hypothetical protein